MFIKNTCAVFVTASDLFGVSVNGTLYLSGEIFLFFILRLELRHQFSSCMEFNTYRRIFLPFEHLFINL